MKYTINSRLLVRRGLAASFRALPHFKGKQKLGVAIARILTDFERPEECVVTFEMRDGTTMRMDLRTTTAAWSYWTGEYDRSVIQHLHGYLREGSAVLDVGAHIGFYSIQLAKRLKELGGILYAFEPIPGNHQALRENIELNGLGSVVRTFNVALGNTEGEVSLHFRDFGTAPTGNAVIVAGRVGELFPPNARARITSLDAMATSLSIRSCSLIKVDIEGYESEFLKGAIGFIRSMRPVIYGEFGTYWTSLQNGDSVDATRELLGALGYTVLMWSRKQGFVAPRESRIGGGNLLFVPVKL